MSLTSRDKKLIMILVPVLALAAYWFLLLGPQRDEASRLGEEASKEQEKADQAETQADRLKAAAKDFRGEYASLVRLGKAVPSSVDMPSLLVQLNRASKGTGIKFGSIVVGERASAAAATGGAAPPASGGSGAQPAPPVASGGQQAQSSPGQNTEKANNAAAGANAANEQRSQDLPADSQTSTSAKQGGVPVGGGTPNQTVQPGAAGGAATPTSGVAGLDSVPIEMSFRGGYFDLARFFHRVKRFVNVANRKISVHGRLLTIDGLSLVGGPRFEAVLKATVYLVPEQQGVNAGATSSGPQATPAGGNDSQPSAPTSAPAPAATATP